MCFLIYISLSFLYCIIVHFICFFLCGLSYVSYMLLELGVKLGMFGMGLCLHWSSALHIPVPLFRPPSIHSLSISPLFPILLSVSLLSLARMGLALLGWVTLSPPVAVWTPKGLLSTDTGPAPRPSIAPYPLLVPPAYIYISPHWCLFYPYTSSHWIALQYLCPRPFAKRCLGHVT